MLIEKRVGIAADHAGYEMKEYIKGFLVQLGINPKDFGTHSADSMDYPDVVHPLASAIQDGELDEGIIVCGSGNGVNMAANKHKGIRSALCWLPEIARLAREHNNANIIALPARYISKDDALSIVKSYLEATFEGGRHIGRVDKIDC